MPRTDDPNDPRGLIYEAFRMDGIDAGQCRTIVLDWALGTSGDYRAAVQALLTRHADQPVDHPMAVTLRDALAEPATARRRGGRTARLAD